MDALTILVRNIALWESYENSMVVDSNDGKLLLNETTMKVFDCINGIRTIQGVIELMIAKYGNENDYEYITEIVHESLSLLMNYNIVVEKQVDEFEEWIVYE
jgi:hypothetical protein